MRHATCALTLFATTCALLAPSAAAQCQTQKFAGVSSLVQDGFGWSMARSNTTLFVGAIGDDTVASMGGAAYVFERQVGGWVEVQKLTIPTAIMNGEFGNSVSVVGDQALIGSHMHVGGKVYHFQRVAGVWNQLETLTSSDGQPTFHFGHHVMLDANGQTAIIGQMRDDYNGFETGSAYVFELVGGAFVQVKKLTGSDSATGDRFGRTVAIDGDRIMVAGHKHAGESGKVYIFERDDNGTPANPLDDNWPQVGSLVASDAAAGDHFGLGLSLDGDLAVVGAAEDVQGALQTGSAYVFAKVAGTWSELQKLVPNLGANGDGFGTSVLVKGDTLLVGARGSDKGASQTGSVHVYRRLAGFFLPAVELVAGDAGANWNQGDEVSLTLLGNEVLSTAWGADSNKGAAYAFELPEIYCQGKLNTAGCVPVVSFVGSHASSTNTEPFKVTAALILNKQNGIFFYGTSGQASIPFQGGTLCASPPIIRTGIQFSGGSTGPDDCTGKYQIDLNALIQSGSDLNLVPGASLYGQYWYRDPTHPVSGSGLSNAIQVEICD